MFRSTATTRTVTHNSRITQRRKEIAASTHFFSGLLDMIHLAGGDGILVDRLSGASMAQSGAAYTADPPFADLAKCAQFEQIGSYDRAEPECEAAAKADPESPWPRLALSRCLDRLMQIEAAGEQANQAARLSPEIANAHASLDAFLSSLTD